jgi:hypothetical protein
VDGRVKKKKKVVNQFNVSSLDPFLKFNLKMPFLIEEKE